ncbi:hypothetical protein Tco_0927706 [Tanacetum coccineum]
MLASSHYRNVSKQTTRFPSGYGWGSFGGSFTDPVIIVGGRVGGDLSYAVRVRCGLFIATGGGQGGGGWGTVGGAEFRVSPAVTEDESCVVRGGVVVLCGCCGPVRDLTRVEVSGIVGAEEVPRVRKGNWLGAGNGGSGVGGEGQERGVGLLREHLPFGSVGGIGKCYGEKRNKKGKSSSAHSRKGKGEKERRRRRKEEGEGKRGGERIRESGVERKEVAVGSRLWRESRVTCSWVSWARIRKGKKVPKGKRKERDVRGKSRSCWEGNK